MNLHGDFDHSKVVIYLVGGFVRDHFMEVEPKDKDYVVVGSSPEEMLSLGFKQVGADFPVYLHPVSGDEYALARTERKSGEGYQGFTCEWSGVTLEEDLSRRDLTINSIAWDCTRNLGKVHDPFGGIKDIKDKVLRHTSGAFVEDPLRVLRVARFMARFNKYYNGLGDSWKVAPETLKLLVSMELTNLTHERVWLELEKALGEYSPSVFFDELSLWNTIFPEWQSLWDTPQREDHHPEGNVGIHTGMVMDYLARNGGSEEEIFAALCHDFGKPICWDKYENAHGHEKEGLSFINNFCDKWKVPNKYRKLALITCEYHTKVHGCLGRGTNKGMKPKSIMKLFEDTGALRDPVMFRKMLVVCEADAKGRGSGQEQIAEFESRPYPQRIYLEDCLSAVLHYSSKEVSRKLLSERKSGIIIGQTIRQEKIKKIREVVDAYKFV